MSLTMGKTGRFTAQCTANLARFVMEYTLHTLVLAKDHFHAVLRTGWLLICLLCQAIQHGRREAPSISEETPTFQKVQLREALGPAGLWTVH